MEVSSFIDLPEERCAFSQDGETCVAEVFHGGDHVMRPRNWIVNVKDADRLYQERTARALADALTDFARHV